jgi:hypothetical protein
MGTLTPGASYVYERVDGVLYSRELGSTERMEIGRYYNAASVQEQKDQMQLWADINRAAKTNPTLQNALDQCIMIYKLSKEYDNESRTI